MVHYRLRNGLDTFHYFFPLWDLSNSLLSDPNGYRMQKLFPKQVDVPSYYFHG